MRATNIDWSGTISKGVTGIRRDKMSGSVKARDNRARTFVGPLGIGAMTILCVLLAVFVNPWLGLACLVVSARRWPELWTRTTVTTTSKDDFALYLETIGILGRDHLARDMEDLFSTLRGHGRDEQYSARVALTHFADDIRDAGLNLPERFS